MIINIIIFYKNFQKTIFDTTSGKMFLGRKNALTL